MEWPELDNLLQAVSGVLDKASDAIEAELQRDDPQAEIVKD